MFKKIICLMVLGILLFNLMPAMGADPVTAEGWIESGKESLECSNTESALYCFENAIEIDPECAEAWYYRGVAYYHINGKTTDFELESYEKALEIDPSYEKAWFAMGWALFDIGKYEEAIECFDKTLEINPENKEAAAKRQEALKALNK